MDRKSITKDNSRVKDVTIVKPIVYGSTATYFGKKREEDNHTHSWSLYVRPYYKEDMSLYVRKVVFKLHESYANPTRIVLEPPYEIHETGWGEFEAIIKIFFHDTNERHVNIYHIIRLFENDSLVLSGQKALVREAYDEIVFHEPTVYMYNLLKSVQTSTVIAYHATDFEEKKQTTLKAIMNGRNEVRAEINDFKECLKEAKDLIQSFKKKITKAEEEQTAETTKS